MSSSNIRTALLLCMFFPAILFAQSAPQDPEKFSDRLFFGGNFGLQFGSYTYVDVSPLVGYKITPRLGAGISLTYIYYSVNDDYNHYNYSTHVYGGSVFTRFYITEQLFAHAEYELLNLETYSPYNIPLGRVNVPSLLLGGGYRMPMGSSSSFNIELLFEVLEDKYSPYTANPIIRVGFGFGI